MNDLEAVREVKRRWGIKGDLIKDPVYHEGKPTSAFRCYVGVRENVFGFASLFLEGQGSTWDEAFLKADENAALRKLKPAPRPVMKLVTKPSSVVGEGRLIGHTYRKENTMVTNLFSAKEVNGKHCAVETSTGRVVAEFGSRKGLAEAYANRLNKAGKPAGYDPKAKAAKPAPEAAKSAS